MNGSELHGLSCLFCLSENLELAKNERSIHCTACHQKYAVFDQRIPLLLADSTEYAANTYKQYALHLKRYDADISALRSKKALREEGAVGTLIQALAHNRAWLQSVQDKVAELLAFPDLFTHPPIQQLGSYFNNFSYLRRDWCWTHEGEAEIKTITEALSTLLLKLRTDPQRALVLGAGTGRVAHELLQHFTDVIAVDISLTMASQYADVVQQPAHSFYDINLNNCKVASDQCRLMQATLTPADEGVMAESNVAHSAVSYVIADARQLPLANQSVSCVVSVYFTDTIPLSEYLAEIKRVLKPGGAFLHFGPLEYHFTEMAHALSKEEIFAVFQREGFEVSSEWEVATRHLYNPALLAYKTYNNIIFCAVLPPLSVTDEPQISEKSILAYLPDTLLTATMKVQSPGQATRQLHLVTASGAEFTVEWPLHRLLYAIDGTTPVDALIYQSAVTACSELGLTEQDVLAFLQSLVLSKVLAITEAHEPCLVD